MVNIKRKMQDISEFDFIRSIKDNCLFTSEKIIKGIGDDCAVIGPYNGKVLLITTDLLIQDVHFILEKIPPEHIGQKAVAVNLSDIAAMGGKALHLFISLGIPKSMDLETLHSIYHGIKTMCKDYRVDILGGDTSASMDKLMINITLIGEAFEEEVLYRTGAESGDDLYVTGTLGDSAAGLKLIKEEFSAPQAISSALKIAHTLPFPFIEVGRMIAQSRLASAMIDISDGLLSDLQHICKENKVGADLFRADLPLSEELRALSEINAFSPYELALSGGEDYRLLVTVPHNNKEPFKKMFIKGSACHVYRVGRITEKAGIRIIGPDGTEKPLKTRGFNHFKSTP